MTAGRITLRLLGRDYCHLCQDMRDALQLLSHELCFDVDYVDVDSNSELEGRYGDLVPVLLDSKGAEICHYFLDEAVLRERLAVK